MLALGGFVLVVAAVVGIVWLMMSDPNVGTGDEGVVAGTPGLPAPAPAAVDPGGAVNAEQEGVAAAVTPAVPPSAAVAALDAEPSPAEPAPAQAPDAAPDIAVVTAPAVVPAGPVEVAAQDPVPEEASEPVEVAAPAPVIADSVVATPPAGTETVPESPGDDAASVRITKTEPPEPAPSSVRSNQPELTPFLASEDPSERRRGLRNLAERRDRESWLLLGRMLREEEDGGVRALAWDITLEMWNKRLGDVDLLQDILAWQLAHGRAQLAADAAKALGERGDKPELLIPGLRRPGHLNQNRYPSKRL